MKIPLIHKLTLNPIYYFIALVMISASCGAFYFLYDSQQGHANEAKGSELSKLTHDSIQLYADGRNAKLNQLSKTNGSEKKTARILFNDFIPAANIKDLVKKYKLSKVKEIYIGWGDHKAGYTAKNGETLNAAISSATKAHEEFLNVVISAKTQPELLIRFQKEKEEFDKTGIMIYGFDADGEINQLNNLKNENKNIWLIDMDETNQGRLITPISPNDFNSLK